MSDEMKGCAGIGVAAALLLVVCLVGWGIHLAMQPVAIINKTLDADNVIYNYEWFKLQYQTIEAGRIQITQTYDQIRVMRSDLAKDRKDWSFQDREEFDRLNSVLLGQKNYLSSLISEYNAKSHMANRSIFKTNELPTEIKE